MCLSIAFAAANALRRIPANLPVGVSESKVSGVFAKLLDLQPFALHVDCRCVKLNDCPGWRVEMCLVRCPPAVDVGSR